MSDDFVRDLELELAAAARRRAAGGREPRRLPAAPWARRRLPVLAATLVAAALVPVVALIAGGGGSRVGDRGDTSPPPASVNTVPLLDSLPPARDCGGAAIRVRSDVDDLALLRREQRSGDLLPDVPETLPVRTFAIEEMRRALPDPAVFVVPAHGVPLGRSCRTGEGAGVCLVELDRRYRCFPRAALVRGEVLMRLGDGRVAGLAPDGVGAVVLNGVETPVRGNAYLSAEPEARETVELALEGAERCAPALSDRVAARLPLLGQDAAAPLPTAAQGAIEREIDRNEARPVAAVRLDAAVSWGERDRLSVWLVPAVSETAGRECAPADGACVVAIPDGAPADAVCAAPLAADVRSAPLAGGRTMVFGLVDPDVTGMRARDGIGRADDEVLVPAHDGVVGGVAPFDGDGQLFLEPVRDESRQTGAGGS